MQLFVSSPPGVSSSPSSRSSFSGTSPAVMGMSYESRRSERILALRGHTSAFGNTEYEDDSRTLGPPDV